VRAGTLPTEFIFRVERQMVLGDLEEVPEAKASAATRTWRCLRFEVSGSADMLALLRRRRVVRARAGSVLEVHYVTALSGATGDAPNPRGYALYFVKTLLGKGYAALQAGGEPEGG
jgi:hypothetical protein